MILPPSTAPPSDCTPLWWIPMESFQTLLFQRTWGWVYGKKNKCELLDCICRICRMWTIRWAKAILNLITKKYNPPRFQTAASPTRRCISGSEYLDICCCFLALQRCPRISLLLLPVRSLFLSLFLLLLRLLCFTVTTTIIKLLSLLLLLHELGEFLLLESGVCPISLLSLSLLRLLDSNFPGNFLRAWEFPPVEPNPLKSRILVHTARF